MAAEHYGFSVSRRQFMQGAGALGLGLLAGCGQWPGQAQAPAARAPRIGVLFGGTVDFTADVREAFRQSLTDLGYVEGRDVVIEWRYANGALDQTPALAAELIALPAAVIVVQGSASAEVLLRLTSTIPVVVAGGGTNDLVDAGLAASYAHPGGQVTGLSIPPQLEGKRLQILSEIIPGLARVAVLRDPYAANSPKVDYDSFARRLGLQLQLLHVDRPDELDAALAAAASEGAEALDVPAVPLLTAQRGKIIAFAAQHRLPATYGRRELVVDGGFVSYEPQRTALHRRAAHFVDRILKGAKPSDLPLEQPREFEFVINLKTAQALGLAIPQHVLLQATEIIQ
jgi:putative tryptophan/tyrosine transport system substrate-binding protein